MNLERKKPDSFHNNNYTFLFPVNLIKVKYFLQIVMNESFQILFLISKKKKSQ